MIYIHTPTHCRKEQLKKNLLLTDVCGISTKTFLLVAESKFAFRFMRSISVFDSQMISFSLSGFHHLYSLDET